MAKVTGLKLRGGVYQLRTTVPKDLQARFGRECIRKSLGTSDRPQAELLGSIERARLLALFNTAKQSPAPLSNLSEQAQMALAPLQGIILPSVTPPPPAATQAAPPLFACTPTLKQLYGRWLKSKKRTRSSESYCLLAVESCIQVIGNLRIDQFTRAHGDSFRSWLLTQDISSKTARMRLVWVKTLLRYAHKELELIPRQPWEGLDIQVSKEQTRRAWRDEELQQLFSQSLFTSYNTPKGCKSGSDAAYWIPLIGLYTGARIGELAQLKTDDIFIADGVPMLRITDSGTGQRLKSDASKRDIPIHSELVRLGLLEYAKAIKAAGYERLWPILNAKPERPGLYISNWFGEFRREAGLTEKYPDFHSFRHLIRTRMSKAKIPEKVQDAITGHEMQGSIGTKVYQGIDLEDRIEAIEAVYFPCLELPKVYTAPRLEKAQRGGWKSRVEARRKLQGDADKSHIVKTRR